MKTINNTVNSISLRKNLRNNATPQEILLWLQLKNKHYEEAAVDYDQKRTELLSRYGIRVLRFTNGDINTNITSVIEKIQRILESPPLTPPQ